MTFYPTGGMCSMVLYIGVYDLQYLKELLASPWLTNEGVGIASNQEEDQNKQHEDPWEEEAETNTSVKENKSAVVNTRWLPMVKFHIV